MTSFQCVPSGESTRICVSPESSYIPSSRQPFYPKDMSVCLATSVMFNSLGPHGLYSPPGSSVCGDSSGKNTGVGCHYPPPGDLPNTRFEPRSPALQADSLLSEAPIFWPPDANSQLIGKDPDAGKDWRQEEDDRGQDGWVISLTQRTWVWASSRRWWRTGKPGMLQSMGPQRVRHDWVTS